MEPRHHPQSDTSVRYEIEERIDRYAETVSLAHRSTTLALTGSQRGLMTARERNNVEMALGGRILGLIEAWEIVTGLSWVTDHPDSRSVAPGLPLGEAGSDAGERKG